MSKLSFLEFEYFRASTVKGQNILKISKVIPSPITRAIAIQVNVLILPVIPEYRI
jgi:hypothetical protein